MEIGPRYYPDQCSNLYIANEQRIKERDRGEGDKGTASFEKAGCYKCDGYKECHLKYSTIREIFK